MEHMGNVWGVFDLLPAIGGASPRRRHAHWPRRRRARPERVQPQCGATKLLESPRAGEGRRNWGISPTMIKYGENMENKYDQIWGISPTNMIKYSTYGDKMRTLRNNYLK